MPGSLTTVVLCGGKGTRAWPATAEVPKPMLPVADRPALAHVIEIYARQGVRRFVLATGYRGDVVADWARTLPSDLEVIAHDTGEESNTGERVRRCGELEGDTSFAPYGDGLGTVDIGALLATHRAATETGALATVTTVALPSQYGTVDTDGEGRVTGFNEKPLLHDHRINAGFFVFEKRALEAWAGPDRERDVLPDLAGRRALQSYKHPGFWKSMDTQKDVADMTRLATEGGSPWLQLPSTQRS